jgi:hypothetical protein
MLVLILGLAHGGVAQAPTPSLRLEFSLPGPGSSVFFGAAAAADVALDGSVLVVDPLNKTVYRFGVPQIV